MNQILHPALLMQRAPEKALLNDWHVVGYSSDFTPGILSPVTLMGRDLVAWRDSTGQAHVWEDLCIHRGSRLSKGTIRDDKVVCPYHGWNYDGSAKCVLIPASPDKTPMKNARAIAHKVIERYGFVWASLGEPQHDVPFFPEWDDASYKKVHCGPYDFRSGYRAVENFFDPSHFPFVHPGVNGVLTEPDPIAPFEVGMDEQGLFTDEVRVTQPYGDPRKIPVTAFYAYRCMRPLIAYFKKRVVVMNPQDAHLGNPNDRFCTFFTAQLVDETRSIVRICCATNFDPQPSDDDVRRRQDIVYEQDSAIVDTQRPELIPVELRDELHHSSDRLSVKYRGWLRSLGISYGTA